MIGKTNAFFASYKIKDMAFRDYLNGDYRFNKNDEITGQNRNTAPDYKDLSLQVRIGDSELINLQDLDVSYGFKANKGINKYVNNQGVETEIILEHSGYFIESGYLCIPDLSKYWDGNGFRIAFAGTKKQNERTSPGTFAIENTNSNNILKLSLTNGGRGQIGSTDFTLPDSFIKTGYQEYEIIYNQNKTITFTICNSTGTDEQNFFTITSEEQYETNEFKQLFINTMGDSVYYDSFLLEYLTIFGRKAYADKGTEYETHWDTKTYSATKHGSFSSDDNSGWENTYKNILYATTGMDDAQAGSSETKEAGQSNFTSQQLLVYPKSVILYNEDFDYARFPIALRMYGKSKPWNWGWDNLRVFGSWVSNTNDLTTEREYWTKNDSRYNIQWLLNASGQNPGWATNYDQTSAYHNKINNAIIANTIKYEPTQEYYTSKIFKPIFNYRIGSDQNNQLHTDLEGSRKIYIFNTKMAEYINTREQDSFPLRLADDYTAESYNNFINAMKELENKDPNSYFTNSTDDTITADFEAATKNYENLIDAAIAAKAQMCKKYIVE